MLSNFKSTTFSSNKVYALESFHTNALRSFLQVDRSTPISIIFLEFATKNLATLLISRFT